MNYNYYIAQNNYLKQLLYYRRNPEVREEALRIVKSLKLQKKEIEREYVGKRFFKMILVLNRFALEQLLLFQRCVIICFSEVLFSK